MIAVRMAGCLARWARARVIGNRGRVMATIVEAITAFGSNGLESRWMILMVTTRHMQPNGCLTDGGHRTHETDCERSDE